LLTVAAVQGVDVELLCDVLPDVETAILSSLAGDGAEDELAGEPGPGDPQPSE
jgi:hypothetical protein